MTFSTAVVCLQYLASEVGQGDLPYGGLSVVTFSLRVILQLNMAHDSGAPFTGMSAFAHKGGIHVSAVNKIPDSYQHIDPSHVGNKRRYVCPFMQQSLKRSNSTSEGLH